MWALAETNAYHSMGLTEQPAWKYEDLGRPLPSSPHACSVALPTWDSVIAYEEGHERVMKKLSCGYPRFLIHNRVSRLFSSATRDCAGDGEIAIVFRTNTIAQRAQRYVELKSGDASRIVSYEGLQALVISEELEKLALQYWRYTGEVVSSRLAEDVMGQGLLPEDASLQKRLRMRLAELNGAEPDDVYVFESGMSGIFAIHRAVNTIQPGKKTLQMEFPYVDAMRVQQNFGAGVAYLNESEGEDCDEAMQRIRRGEFTAVFCEMPSNPLLRCVNLPQVAEACRAGGVALIVDDTVCSSYNVDVLRYADAVTTSLTKWISGKGDVMGGQVTLNPQSPLYFELKSLMQDACEKHRLYVRDAEVLLENAKGFEERIQKVNHNGEALYAFLKEHPQVENVWYPKENTQYRYEDVKCPNGGYGGLLSFTVKGNNKRVQRVFDALEVSKGPSLGTEFTLACPYTMLAHYDDLDWAESCGVPRHLIRISVGIEDTDRLLGKLQQSLEV